VIQKNPLVKVDRSVNLLELERTVRVTSGDLLSVDVGDTEVSPGLLLGVVNGHDGEGVLGTELRAVAPRDVDGRAGGAGLVGPRLGGGILDVEADDGASLGRTVVARGKVEVVVTARLVLGAVAAQVLDGPGQAVGLGLTGGCGGSGGGVGSAAGGLGGLGGSRRGNRCGGGRAVTTGNGGSVADDGSHGRGCWGGKSKSAVGRDTRLAVRVAVSRVACVSGGSSRGRRSDQSQRPSSGNAGLSIGVAVSRVAGVGRSSRRCGSRKSESSVSRDARLAVRVAVSWVASVSGGRRRRGSRKSQTTVGRDAGLAVGVAVRRVAGVSGGRRWGRCRKSEATVGGDTGLAIRVAVSRVASVSRSSWRSESESTIGRDARLAIGVAVCRVASVGSAGGSRCHKRESSVGRDTLDSLRVGVGRVAGVLRGRGLITSERTGEGTGGGRGQREDESAVHVGMR
jgi:tetrahydromethanopterin S-methyltransferase subunit F